jgi:hypothetical protein
MKETATKEGQVDLFMGLTALHMKETAAKEGTADLLISINLHGMGDLETTKEFSTQLQVHLAGLCWTRLNKLSS